ASNMPTTTPEDPPEGTRGSSRIPSLLSDVWSSLRNRKALIDCCKELKLPEEVSTSPEEENRGGLTMYESDMLSTGSPITLGLLAALTYPIAWRSVSRMHLFRNRPVLPQFLAIVPPVAFLYVAGVYNCRVVMSRFVRDEGERSQRAREVVALYRERAPVDYAALRRGMAGCGLTLVSSRLMSKLSEETQDLLLRTKIDDVLRKSLLKFLEQIREEPRAELFLVPVDQKVYPSYKDFVKRPMDLSTMEMKVKGQRPRGRKPRVPRPLVRHVSAAADVVSSSKYSTGFQWRLTLVFAMPIQKYQFVQDVFNDLEQIWTNSMIFNKPGCDAYADALEMREITCRMVDDWVIANIPNARMKEVEPSPTVRLTAEALREVSEAEGEPSGSVSAPTKKSRKDSKKGDGSSKLSKRKKKRKKRAASESSSSDGDLDSPASPSSFPAPAALDRFSLLTPSPGERNALAARITRLHPENLARIVKLLSCSEQSEKDALAVSNGEGDGSVFTIKLDLIDNKTFWVLSNLVKLQLRQQEHEQYKRYHDKIATVSTTSSQEKEPPPLWRKCLAEVFGTAVLLAFGSGVVAQVNVCGLGNYLCIAIGWALGVTFGVLASFRISGAHLNPAVSLASCVYKQMPWKDLLPYVGSQVLGAFIGACITYLCYYQDFKVQDLSNAGVFATYPREGDNAFNSVVNEVVGSSLLTAAIAAVTDPQDKAPANRFHVAGFVGLVVLAIGLSFGVNTGYAINPARDFGPRLFSALAGWGPQVFTADNYYFW
ncbi:hypothetical protein FOZ63_028574, partial [Perkinsus olseni]